MLTPDPSVLSQTFESGFGANMIYLWPDGHFVKKVEDIVSLYLNPAGEGARAVHRREEPDSRARPTQPGVPLKKGRAGTMTHDYKRNGGTTLFAALDGATGKVIGECLPHHGADEFLAFLRKIDRETPGRLDLHLVIDNYATHKTEKVKCWLARHKRFKLTSRSAKKSTAGRSRLGVASTFRLLVRPAPEQKI